MADKKETALKTDAEKQKQQLIILAVMMLGAGIYLGYTMYLQPKLKSLTDLEDKLTASKQNLSKVQTALRGSKKLDGNFVNEYQKIELLSRKAFPPAKNSLMWVGAVVGKISSKLGVQANKRSYKDSGTANIVALPKVKRLSKS